MWESTNFEQQRKHMENADLSVGLMYGGGGQGAVSQGGQATQPSGPTSNPIGMALQYKQIEQQDAAIKSQTMLNQAEAAKALAEAGKTAGPEYNKATWEAKNLEIENRIKTITEGITGANLTEAEANAQKVVAEWNSAMAKAEVDQATKETDTYRTTDQYEKRRGAHGGKQRIKRKTKTTGIVTGKQIGRAHV